MEKKSGWEILLRVILTVLTLALLFYSLLWVTGNTDGNLLLIQGGLLLLCVFIAVLYKVEKRA